MKKKIIASILLFTSTFAFYVLTEKPLSPQQIKGTKIARQIDKNYSGFNTQIVSAQMILRNRKGQESSRELLVKTIEVAGDGEKTLTVFKGPADIKGTALLTFAHFLEPDDQWLYLPGIKRVKRISSSNKSGPFVGSEFAYEDLSAQEFEKYAYRFEKEETLELDGKSFLCDIIERTPLYKKSGYRKQRVWSDQKESRVMKIEFYDRKGDLLKTLTYHNYKKYEGADKWRATTMKMKNHNSGKSTDLVWSGYTFGKKIKTSEFNQNALKRIGR